MGNVTIEKDGWKVSGDTEEQLAIGIRAVQIALGEPKKVTIHVRNPRRVAKDAASRVQRKHEPPPGGTERFIKNAKRAIRMLKALHAHGPVSGTEPLMKALGATDPKGFGGMAAGVNRAITACGFDINDVYTTERLPEGRRWHEQSRLDDALTALDAAIADSEGG